MFLKEQPTVFVHMNIATTQNDYHCGYIAFKFQNVNHKKGTHP